MCSILGILSIKTDASALRRQSLKLSKLQRHRGPDWSGIYSSKEAILVHERLAIVDIEHGAQPLFNHDRSHVLAVNGEIYNHENLQSQLNISYEFQTRSDCEIILALYKEKGDKFLDQLNGMFAFVLYDAERSRYLIARDHLGIIPLYTGYDDWENFYVASEMKTLIPICQKIEEFPPGHYLSTEEKAPVQYYQRSWQKFSNISDSDTDVSQLCNALEAAVRRHLMTDVPYGVLLSGGLDSSIIAAIAKKYSAKRVETNNQENAWWPQLHSFAIGLEGAPDLMAAKEAANYIGTVHHEMHFTVQEGIDALHDVIYHLETYDVTTVRASTPMYLLARKIKAMGVKMVLSGEGSDEIFGGYLYFHKAPCAREFHEETLRKLNQLHFYDCLRANKAMAAWGVEARVPFLDKAFLDVAMSINPRDKMISDGKIEKQVLREAFKDYLPESILWRQKEQFSDGVGYTWIDSLKSYAEKEISDRQMEEAYDRFPINTPTSKEAYLYRHIFAEHFPLDIAAECVPGGPSVACSTPEALLWDRSFQQLIDPSGRAVRTVHRHGY